MRSAVMVDNQPAHEGRCEAGRDAAGCMAAPQGHAVCPRRSAVDCPRRSLSVVGATSWSFSSNCCARRTRRTSSTANPCRPTSSASDHAADSEPALQRSWLQVAVVGDRSGRQRTNVPGWRSHRPRSISPMRISHTISAGTGRHGGTAACCQRDGMAFSCGPSCPNRCWIAEVMCHFEPGQWLRQLCEIVEYGWRPGANCAISNSASLVTPPPSGTRLPVPMHLYDRLSTSLTPHRALLESGEVPHDICDGVLHWRPSSQTVLAPRNGGFVVSYF